MSTESGGSGRSASAGQALALIRHAANLTLWVLPPSRMFALRRLLLRMSGVDVGTGVCVCGRGWIYGRGQLRIGDGTWMSPGVTVHTHVEAPVRIGDRCDIGPGVEFITGSHEMGGSARRAGPGKASPITVGNGCWIGAGTKILGGTCVGEGAVVAAGSVVTRDVEANTLVAGVPALPKRHLGE